MGQNAVLDNVICICVFSYESQQHVSMHTHGLSKINFWQTSVKLTLLSYISEQIVKYLIVDQSLG